jgi:hypothetical protein
MTAPTAPPATNGAHAPALVGRKGVAQASPPVPTRPVAGVQADLATVKRGLSR